jgi:hypothetical protein
MSTQNLPIANVQDASAGATTQQAQAGAGAEGGVAQEKIVADIGEAESYLHSLSQNTERLAANAISFDEQLKNVALQALQNAVTVANRISQSGATHDNEVNATAVFGFTAQPFFQDAVESAVARAFAKQQTAKTS